MGRYEVALMGPVAFRVDAPTRSSTGSGRWTDGARHEWEPGCWEQSGGRVRLVALAVVAAVVVALLPPVAGRAGVADGGRLVR